MHDIPQEGAGNQYHVILSAVLTALLDVGGKAPEGPMYAAMMEYAMTLNEFNAIISCLETGGLVTRSYDHLVSLTAKGTEVAQRLADICASAGKK